MTRTSRILVTGASGFIGRAVCRLLARDGHHIRAISRNPDAFGPPVSEVAGLPRPAGDETAWRTMLDGIDHVIHCAGLAHSRGETAIAYREANVELTRSLARVAAATISGKFVFLSSIRAVVGPVSDGIVDADAVAAPVDDYGRSKLEAESAVAAALGRGGRYTVLRPTLVYGEGMKGNLAALMKLAASPLPLPLAGIGAKRSLLDVEACATAAAHALTTPETNGNTYIVCDENPVAAGEIVEAFRRGFGRAPRLFALPEPVLAGIFSLTGRAGDWERLSGSLVADPSAYAATGWQPATDTLRRLEQLARGLKSDKS